MGPRRLSPEERALWAKVAASVRPFVGRAAPPPPPLEPASTDAPLPTFSREPRPAGRPVAPARRPGPGETLDGGWDRRLARGLVAPDRGIDLHGHTLASAHSALEEALHDAVTSGARLLLVVTGKPPGRAAPGDQASPRRGLIRAAIGDWLAVSPHAGDIAAIRNAHPRHGGAGALYVVIRRRRGGAS